MMERADSQSGLLRSFRGEALLLTAIAVLGCAAAWMTLNRAAGYDVECVRTADLYQLAETPRVAGFTFAPSGELTLEIENLEERSWREERDGRPTAAIEGQNPVIVVERGIGQATLIGVETGTRLSLGTQWSGPGHAEPLVSLSTLRVGAASGFSFSDFVTQSEAQPAEEVSAARRMIASWGDEEASPTLDRIALLARHLHQDLLPHRGSPTPAMRGLNGFEQYEEAMAGRSGVYCGNHAEIFAFFANAAGIPTRLVDVAGRIDDVAVGAHSFAESFVEEDGRWVYVDLQLDLAGVRDGGGVSLGAAELLDRIRSGTTGNLVAHRIAEGGVLEQSWSERAGLYETFLTPTATLVYLSASPNRYQFTERLRRLLLDPRPAVCEAGAPGRVHLRLGATWLTLGLAATWLGLRLRFMRIRRAGAAL